MSACTAAGGPSVVLSLVIAVHGLSLIHISILVELAYLSNVSDAQKLRDDPYGFAQGIYNGLLSYFGFSPA